jgi:hypothetical protein
VIRAFKAERHLQKQFDNLQNMQSCVYYLYRAMFYSFAFWTDITCAFYASILVLYLFLSETGKSIGVLSGASTKLSVAAISVGYVGLFMTQLSWTSSTCQRHHEDLGPS